MSKTTTPITNLRVRTAREIGLVVRDSRKKLGLDQATLAKRVGVSRQWIIAIEQGKSGAEIGLILRTLNALDLVVTIQAEQDPVAPSKQGNRKNATKTPQPMIDIHSIIDRARGRR